jgi:hypothetical protein
MRIFLGGAEKGTHRSLLIANSVQRMGVNVTHLPIPKKKEFVIDQVFAGAELLVYTSEGDEDLNRYVDFVREYADQLTYVIGRPDMDGDWLGDKYVPVWNDGDDLERLAWLCQRYGRAAISDKAINTKTLPRIRSLSQRWGAQLFGMTSKPEVIEALPWDVVIVGSWTSSIRFGETQIWDGHGLRRYPAQQKESSRKKHRPDILRLGVDYDAVMEDSVDAVGTLAIRSWMQWEERTFGGYDPQQADDETEFNDPLEGEIVDIPPSTPNGHTAVSKGTNLANAPLEKRHESERVLLPVMGIEHLLTIGTQMPSEQGEYIEVDPQETPVIRYQSNSIRQCDSCYLASRCHAFKEHSDCGFKLPVDIKTKDQLNAVLQAMIEMQTSRVLFARFAEELEGQGLDPALSSEMDRLFSLIDKFKNISDTRDLMRIEVEARGNAGVLSRLFGQKAGETARQLPGGGMDVNQTDKFIQSVIDINDPR